MTYILPRASSRNNNKDFRHFALQHRTKVPFHACLSDTYNEPSSPQFALLSPERLLVSGDSTLAKQQGAEKHWSRLRNRVRFHDRHLNAPAQYTYASLAIALQRPEFEFEV
jgi:hypothetical protein